ncbi:MAG: ATP-dependent DNA helicase RecG [Melioribacteraceae bacterium]|nr:ATP-dependent DNA helicase RecG [Melioribacteraceae bacterium]MCF8353497.1 ATP-dependent DNA helicase RecG [Melioribacteraceae bacterium]MCF8392626.1 ATP-dependent DNA helicase RecG [Melioribacteraceae bacterium]MCF8418502.1 ATP-dependent DNA helicase RecG [Melioribacteraceae bacterium]
MQSNLDQPVQYLKSVGPKRAESFRKVGITTIRDLLFYFPTRYLDRSTILTSSKVIQYLSSDYAGEVTIIGSVIDKEKIRYGKRQLFKVRMRDSQGFFECVWFQGIKYFTNLFNIGEYFAISAKPVITKYGHLQFVHPDFDKLNDSESQEFLNTGKIIPHYPLSKELRDVKLGDLSLRRIISSAVEMYVSELGETLPEWFIEKHSIPGIVFSIKNIHFPENSEQLKNAITRFKIEELFYLEILIALRKKRIKAKNLGIKFSVDPGPVKKILAALPFDLTSDQLKVLHEIRVDMESEESMNRLLQGDVGSGKTIVALIAMIIAVSNGFQAALMVPTEILADQHFKTISKLLKNFDYKINLVIGGQKKSDRDKNLKDILSQSNLIIGTHALFEQTVNFKNLGLVIIDEQHRFGVAQRAGLIMKGKRPDVIIMTATPIPRTMSLTVYGDLDVSTIKEKPQNRKSIKTKVVAEKSLPEVFNYIVENSRKGFQSFIVYPLVEESEKLELKAAETYYEKLKSTFLKNISVGLLHGKMNWKDKEKVMMEFAEGKFDVLISTTVIEVGIDIPNANMIVINDAFRFGLSQLHQLRGRVGRNDVQSYCILVTKNEYAVKSAQYTFDFSYLSKSQIEKNKSIIRLNAMAQYDDGFKLSEIDLKLRGPGDIFGIKQSGFPELKFADIVNDVELLIKAKEDAFELIKIDPDLSNPQNSILKNIIEEKYKENLHFINIA